MATNQNGFTADQKVRKVSKKRYAKLQAEYDAELNNYTTCEGRIAELKYILKNRSVSSVDKKGNEVNRPLNNAQLSGLSKELWDQKEKLLKIKDALKRFGISFKSAAKRTTKATIHKINQKREKMRLASEGLRNLDSIKSHVADLFRTKTKSDSDISALKVLATTNGIKFHLDFLKKLRKELKDTKIRAYVMSSPKIQGELSRFIRGIYSNKKG